MTTKIFDIIVPTYNRYDQLPEFFKRNSQIEHVPATLWIVDDCSQDHRPEVIPSWKNIVVIRLDINKGQAFARNIAIERGDCEFVISLDDDAWFEDADSSLKRLYQLFNDHPETGCVMFNIAVPGTDYSSTPTGTELPLHVTCGCAYRRSVLNEINGFSGFLHSQAEETDISIRIYQAGWNIIFSNEIKVFHNFSPTHRSLQWYYYIRHNTTRNDLLIVVMYFPPILILPFLAGKYISHLIFAVTHRVSVFKAFWHTGRAFFSFLLLLPIALRNRKPLTVRQFKKWRWLMKHVNK